MRAVMILIGLFTLSACSTMGDWRKSDADAKAESCREDPYQDECQPGYVEPGP